MPYLNLEFFFCIIATLFGQSCAKSVPSVPSVPGVGGVISSSTSSAIDIASTTVSAASQGGFWSWLWPFGRLSFGSSAGAADATTTALTHFLPEPVLHVFAAVGVGAGFIWTTFSWLSYSVSGIIAMSILSSVAGLIFIRLKEWNQYGTLPPRDPSKSYGWSRWQDLLNEAMSSDPKRWRLSIIAADGMLGELLTRLGYHGETTGDQMRGVPDNAFVTVPAAWEAHRIKNFVAARNSNYILTQREAFRVMKLYEQVFEEFDFI